MQQAVDVEGRVIYIYGESRIYAVRISAVHLVKIN